MGEYFKRALQSFAQDVAGGGAIRHLADLGYPVERIAAEIDFPIPAEQVARIVWEHYLQRGVILLEEPQLAAIPQKVRYVKETGKYGTVSLRRIVEEASSPGKSYLPCDFGRERYRDEDIFLNRLERLDREDRAYILGLPWPPERVWHVADARMVRIVNCLGAVTVRGG